MSGELVAVVDDDASARQSIAGLLRALGHHVAEYESGTDLLSARDLSTVACIVADLRMPGLGGLELCQRLVTIGSPIPTIVVTAFPDRTSRERARALGVVAYLTKPVTPDELVASLRAAFGGSGANGSAAETEEPE